MVRQIAITISLLVQFSASAFADTAQYWVAKDAVSKQCEVVPKKPDGTLVIELSKTIYTTEAEAKDALKKLPDCK
jgi:septal ring-binding cell division protein DamX